MWYNSFFRAPIFSSSLSFTNAIGLCVLVLFSSWIRPTFAHAEETLFDCLIEESIIDVVRVASDRYVLRNIGRLEPKSNGHDFDETAEEYPLKVGKKPFHYSGQNFEIYFVPSRGGWRSVLNIEGLSPKQGECTSTMSNIVRQSGCSPLNAWANFEDTPDRVCIAFPSREESEKVEVSLLRSERVLSKTLAQPVTVNGGESCNRHTGVCHSYPPRLMVRFDDGDYSGELSLGVEITGQVMTRKYNNWKQFTLGF